jgi:hypothetical protein
MKSMMGKVFNSVVQIGEEIIFSNDTESYKLYHTQYCCESVYIESVVGDLNDLVGAPILMAQESSGYNETGCDGDVSEWTFYKFATIKGYVDVRWNGSSNGYYSTSVDLDHVVK